MSTTIPEKLTCTGGIYSAAGAALSIGPSRSGGILAPLLQDCSYCLDAPGLIPAGSTARNQANITITSFIERA